jgi:hippurate hydrolase
MYGLFGLTKGLVVLLVLGLATTAGEVRADTGEGKVFWAKRVAEINKRIDDQCPSIVGLYKHLHAHPELSFQEEHTAARLASEMRTLGFEVATGVGGHGVVALALAW